MFITDIIQDLSVKTLCWSTPSVDPDEVWHYIDKLTSFNHVCSLLRKRVEERFFGFGHYIDKLNDAKLAYNAANDEGNRVEIHQILSGNDDIRDNAEEITLLARQAIELYRSSQTASIYAGPIILYYSFAKLGRILFLSVYKSKKATGNHGLTFKEGESVIMKKRGAFPRLHDSYIWKPSIYLDGCVFNWCDLIKDGISRYALMTNIRNRSLVYLHERKSNIRNSENTN
jgi:hypothetical protein